VAGHCEHDDKPRGFQSAENFLSNGKILTSQEGLFSKKLFTKIY
jgi:hypothetical protein